MIKWLQNNPDIDALRFQLSSLNLFEALNAKDYEAKHSNFLAWLLDPTETHALGSLPFEYFVRLVDEKQNKRKQRKKPTSQIEV